MKLSDWDVLTYYAKAKTDKQNTYASEVYFLEVRPFREDILKMPGGEDGKAYQCLNELSALIYRQQHVIRQTHQHSQQPPADEKLQAQDRKKLADAENDLSESYPASLRQNGHRDGKQTHRRSPRQSGQSRKSLDQAGRCLQDNKHARGPKPRTRRSVRADCGAQNVPEGNQRSSR